MNSTQNLLSRLLKLYPVALIKKEFITGSKTQSPILEEISQSYNMDTIKEFAFDYFGFTKQRIFVFNNPAGLSAGGHKFRLGERISTSNNNNGVQIDRFLLIQSYNVFLIPSTDYPDYQIHLNFFQPLVIEFENDHIIFKFTILERTASSYLPNATVLKSERVKEDIDIVEDFKTHYLEMYGDELIPLDITPGVKFLWEQDIIDARSVKYKKESSFATDDMDEDFTFKQKYPNEFRTLILAPLGKHVFKFLEDNGNDYCNFACEPQEGIISFHKYPTNLNQTQNVTYQILSHN
jgi:hypothetical protein